MTRTNLLALGSTGVVAIWEGDDDLPFSAPLDHIANGRLKYHSSLTYRKVIQERKVTLSLPARAMSESGNGEHRYSHNLFAHGRPGIPWILASFRVAGQDVGAVGSVPVQKAANNASSPWARFLSIGANGTNVTAFEYGTSPLRSPAYSFPAISIPITVWITDRILPA